MKLIDKDALVAEIDNILDNVDERWDTDYAIGAQRFADKLQDAIDTLEVKEVDTWHLQEKEDIYDAVKDWHLHTFVCVMKDGTIQRFSGNRDEDYEGHINVHIDGANDDYDSVDDIVKWIELT